jgi:beta-N-acetylhexosaminidase
MKGVVLSEQERVVDNLVAGSDVVLFPDDVPAAVQAVEKAVDTGRITAQAIHDSCRRLLCLKAKVGLDGSHPLPDEATAKELLSPRRLASVCTAIAQRSVTLVRDRAQSLPLKLARGAKVVCLDLPNESFSLQGLVVAGQEEAGRDLQHFDACLKRQGIEVIHVASLDAWKAAITTADAFVIVANTRATAGRGTVRLSYSAQQLVENTRDHRPMPVIACLMGNPYVAWELSMLPTVIACYANNDAVQEHLAKALTGQAQLAGHLPVTLPDTI